jgi:hypothetical protein
MVKIVTPAAQTDAPVSKDSKPPFEPPRAPFGRRARAFQAYP